MARVSAIPRGDGASAAGLRHNRDTAPGGATCHQHVTALLAPFNQTPGQLATRLFHRFGSLGRIVQAFEAELWQIVRAGEAWIDAFVKMRKLMCDGMREEICAAASTTGVRRSTFSFRRPCNV